MVKFKTIVYNPINEKFDMESKVNMWLKGHSNISIQNVTILREDISLTSPVVTYLYIFYEEKENNNE